MIGVFLIWLFSLFLSDRTGKISDRRCASYYVVPVYDLWQHYMFCCPKIWYMPDLFVAIFLGIFIGTSSYSQFEEFFLKASILNFIRCACCLTTTGYVSERYHSVGCNRGWMNCYVSDLCVSGHAMNITLLYLFTYSFSIYMTGLFVLSILSILVAGDHYTSDIILGTSLAVLTYY